MGIDISNIYIEEIEAIRENGYSMNTKIEISEEKVLDTISLNSIEILDINYKDNRFFINSQVFLLGRVYITEFNTQRVVRDPRWRPAVIVPPTVRRPWVIHSTQILVVRSGFC